MMTIGSIAAVILTLMNTRRRLREGYWAFSSCPGGGNVQVRWGDVAGSLVVGVVTSLSTPASEGLRWFRILPRLMSHMSLSSTSPG